MSKVLVKRKDREHDSIRTDGRTQDTHGRRIHNPCGRSAAAQDKNTKTPTTVRRAVPPGVRLAAPAPRSDLKCVPRALTDGQKTIRGPSSNSRQLQALRTGWETLANLREPLVRSTVPRGPRWLAKWHVKWCEKVASEVALATVIDAPSSLAFGSARLKLRQGKSLTTERPSVFN